MHQQMLALSRIQKRRRFRYWLNSVQIAMLVFFSDQILKTWVLRQLAPGDQVQFFGQSYWVLTHLTMGLDGYFFSVLEWAMWLMVAGMLVLRASEAGFSEIASAMTLLLAGLSNTLTRSVLGNGINVFAIQAHPGSAWLSFNIAHLAIAVAAFALTTAWVRALWPESLAEGRPFRV
jgi:lipoprotein signal peptidase